MAHTLCIIDDGFLGPAKTIGVEGHGHFCFATIEIFLSEDWGLETALRDFCTALIQDEENGKKRWQLYAFSNPNFFLNAFKNENLRTDIIVFDWEYPVTIDHVAFLRKIFEATHSFIYIFSGADKEVEINQLLDDNFSQYRSRVALLSKENGVDHSASHTTLLNKIIEMQTSNFSFKFGNELRKITTESLDGILHHLGKMDIEKVVSYLGKEHAEPLDHDLKELIGIKMKDAFAESKRIYELLKTKKGAKEITLELAEFISEKIKNSIIAWKAPHDATPSLFDAEIMQELWSYRLYHNPQDTVVRTGDIIKKKDVQGYDHLYFVLSPLCDLERFWGKTHGYLNLVKLYNVDSCKATLKSQGELVKKASDVKGKAKFNSISNPIDAYGGDAVYIPFIKIGDAIVDYMLFPKETEAVKIELPATRLAITTVKDRDLCLDYSLEAVNYERIASISEPFKSPLIERVLSTLKGYGTPDYPLDLKNHISDRYKGIFA